MKLNDLQNVKYGAGTVSLDVHSIDKPDQYGIKPSQWKNGVKVDIAPDDSSGNFMGYPNSRPYINGKPNYTAHSFDEAKNDAVKMDNEIPHAFTSGCDTFYKYDSKNNVIVFASKYDINIKPQTDPNVIHYVLSDHPNYVVGSYSNPSLNLSSLSEKDVHTIIANIPKGYYCVLPADWNGSKFIDGPITYLTFPTSISDVSEIFMNDSHSNSSSSNAIPVDKD